MAFPGGDRTIKIGFLILVVGEILNIIGFSTPGWLTSSFHGQSLGIGLFQVCKDGICVDTTLAFDSEYLATVEILAVFGIALPLLACLLTILHIVKVCSRPTSLIICIGSCVVGGIMMIAALIVFFIDFFDYSTFGDSYFFYDPSYSFFLCIIGSSLTLMAGGLIFLGVVAQRRAQSALQNNTLGTVPQPQVFYPMQPATNTMVFHGQPSQPQPVFMGPQMYYVQQDNMAAQTPPMCNDSLPQK